MRITHFTAENVHGYLPIHVDFLPDLTFLTGLNGSGKTSALRLLMALITPKIEDFVSINFSTASATIRDNGHDVVISAERKADGLTLRVSRISDELVVSSAEMQLLLAGRRRGEEKMPVDDRLRDHPVILEILKLSTPIFLGLDRRFTYATPLPDDIDARRRELLLRRNLLQEGPLQTAGDLADIGYLVSTTMQEIRAAQEGLDANLRKQILAGAFRYEHSQLGDNGKSPSIHDITEYRKRQAKVEEVAQQLKIPLEEVQDALSTFFEKMNELVSRIEKQPRGKEPVEFAPAFVEWLINKSQIDRILAHINLLDTFSTKRAKLHEPIERFLNLVNGFLSQTRKELRITGRGELKVTLDKQDAMRPLTALSSGERQIVVMLGHLALNKNLAGSSVFIVDEPELSLHIGWQERFVDAIQTANSGVQLIMATHSPAIILDRVQNCRTLNGEQ